MSFLGLDVLKRLMILHLLKKINDMEKFRIQIQQLLYSGQCGINYQISGMVFYISVYHLQIFVDKTELNIIAGVNF